MDDVGDGLDQPEHGDPPGEGSGHSWSPGQHDQAGPRGLGVRGEELTEEGAGHGTDPQAVADAGGQEGGQESGLQGPGAGPGEGLTCRVTGPRESARRRRMP